MTSVLFIPILAYIIMNFFKLSKLSAGGGGGANRYVCHPNIFMGGGGGWRSPPLQPRIDASAWLLFMTNTVNVIITHSLALIIIYLMNCQSRIRYAILL